MIWQKAEHVIEKARKSGALHPISATTIDHEVNNESLKYSLAIYFCILLYLFFQDFTIKDHDCALNIRSTNISSYFR